MREKSLRKEDDETPTLSEEESTADEGVEEAVNSFLIASYESENKTVDEILKEHEDKDGHTALTRAIQQGDAQTVRSLLQQGHSVNRPTVHQKYCGLTPLIFAISARNPSLVRLLVSEGADYKSPLGAGAHEGETPICIVSYIIYPIVEGKWTPTPDPAALEILKFLIQLGASHDALMKTGAFKNQSTAEMSNREKLKAVMDLFNEEDGKMAENSRQFSNLISAKVDAAVSWTSIEWVHQLMVRRKNTSLGFLQDFLKQVGIVFTTEAESIFIKKTDLYAFVADLGKNKKIWAEFFNNRIPVMEELIKDHLYEEQYELRDDCLCIKGSNRNTIVFDALLAKFKPRKVGGVYKIAMNMLGAEALSDVAPLLEKAAEGERKLATFEELASDCGADKCIRSVKGMEIIFLRKYPHEGARFHDYLDDYFPRAYTCFPYEQILKIDAKRLSRMRIDACTQKLEDAKKPATLIEALDCLVLAWKEGEIISTVENMNVERFAVFKYLKKTLELGCVFVGHAVEWDKRDMASLTPHAILLIKKLAKTKLGMLQLLFEAIQNWAYAKDVRYEQDGFEFSLAPQALLKLKECCAPFRLLENKPQPNERFLIRYENVLELWPEAIVAIKNKMEAAKMAALEKNSSPSMALFKGVPPQDLVSAKKESCTEGPDLRLL